MVSLFSVSLVGATQGSAAIQQLVMSAGKHSSEEGTLRMLWNRQATFTVLINLGRHGVRMFYLAVILGKVDNVYYNHELDHKYW